jgi:YidC/Oxa1 family membrane protein insertase
MVVYMLWEAWQVDYGPKKPLPPVANVEQPGADRKDDMPVASSTSTPTAEKPETSIPKTEPTVSSTSVPLIEAESGEIITVTTDVFRLEIDTKGGTLRNLDLLQYPVHKENSEKVVRLLDSNIEKLFLAQSGLIPGSGSAGLSDHHSDFSSQQKDYTLSDNQNILRVPLTWSDDKGFVVTKTYVFSRDSYLIKLEQKISNQSKQAWSGRQYTQLLRKTYEDDKGNTFIRTYAGGVIYTDEDKYHKVSFDDMADENLDVATKAGWTAMIQHYFATAWIPPQGIAPPEDDENQPDNRPINHLYTKQLKESRFVIGSYSDPVTIPVASEQTLESKLFVGPKIQPVMEKVATGLELTVDYSWLSIIGKRIYWLLNEIHNLVDNWGFAIIGVTLCIKLLFFPLSQASFKSMAKMRKIQPRLKDLKEQFGDDRQRFNTEMMNLYKKEKVNPLGGCLPILIQIPVFISLYWVLIETVELRQEPFALWIQDLSAKDPFFVLPLLMGITMKIQQSLNPAPVDPLQAKVIKMFPYVFTVFFLFFPAGLVLYWVVNNTLSIIQQWYITKQIEAGK